MSIPLILLNLAAAGLVGAISAAAQVPAPASAQLPAPASALPAGAGIDVTKKVCSTCHTVEIMARQRLTRTGWSELVQTMADYGAVATDAELATITKYLAAAFPEDKPMGTVEAPPAN